MPPCPFCGQNQYPPVPVSFSWWGGILGPRMLHHATCPQCGKAYNSVTGRPNTNGIIIYSIVVGFIVLGLLFAIR